MRITVDSLRHHLDVFLWENPGWADAQVVVEYEHGGKIYARRALKTKGPRPFNIQWEERVIYDDASANK